jgi:hypothetical protein
MSFSAKLFAYCPRPSFSSQSATCCIAAKPRIIGLHPPAFASLSENGNLETVYPREQPRMATALAGCAPPPEFLPDRCRPPRGRRPCVRAGSREGLRTETGPGAACQPVSGAGRLLLVKPYYLCRWRLGPAAPLLAHQQGHYNAGERRRAENTT